MQKEIVHLRESSDDTQLHLDSNRDKFETDAVFLLRLMMGGKVLSGQDVSDMRINDRRLRELFAEGKCKKRWKLNDAGKRMYVEYYCEIPLPPTKQKAIDWATKFLDNQKGTQQNLF